MSGLFWEKAFDAVTDLVSLHTKDYKIIKINKALQEFLNKSQGELIHPCYREFFGSNKVCDECPLRKTIENKKTYEVEMVRSGKYYLVSTSPIFDNENDVMGAIHILKDISKLKSLENKLMIERGKVSRLGEILLQDKIINEKILQSALKKQKKLGEILLEENIITKKQLNDALAKQKWLRLNKNV